LVRFKVNIFYGISAVCSLALVAYAWFVFLPSFEATGEYESIRYVVILLTILLVAVSGIQIVMSVVREGTEEDETAARLESEQP
jgi:hypothetical protein